MPLAPAPVPQTAACATRKVCSCPSRAMSYPAWIEGVLPQLGTFERPKQPHEHLMASMTHAIAITNHQRSGATTSEFVIHSGGIEETHRNCSCKCCVWAKIKFQNCAASEARPCSCNVSVALPVSCRIRLSFWIHDHKSTHTTGGSGILNIGIWGYFWSCSELFQLRVQSLAICDSKAALTSQRSWPLVWLSGACGLERSQAVSLLPNGHLADRNIHFWRVNRDGV